ncbi:FAD-binding oxidoreductase [Microvirga massiliensis]|uniref:FAD-binding oxidoreductase n=1 Tax=Microvirga massiliensis TaxID=1033741 RepID=UPI001FCD726F|nr:FAD-binding oxidoreductase [Microvirga massiliensis]
MEKHLVDWRRRYRGAAVGVVFPRSTEEVASVVKVCADAGIGIVPQGGNTGMCGGAIPSPDGHSMVVCPGRMNRVREIDPTNNTMTVEAGCILATIQEVAADNDRLFPLSLGSEGSCQIGGNVATNAGGTAVLRYGPMRDLVLGIEAVLPDGRIWNGLSRLRKDNTGYDLKQLFIGSEGTLGIITAVVLKLYPKPHSQLTALAAILDLDLALALLSRLRSELGDRISNFEIMSRNEFALVLAHNPELVDPLDAASPWYAFIEVTDTIVGDDLAAALEESLAAALESGIATDAVIAANLAQAAAIWRIRHSVTEANIASGFSISHDTSVPVSQVPTFVAQVDAAIAAALPEVSTYYVGHLGDGNIHVVVVFPRDTYATQDHFDDGVRAANAIVDRITVALGGSISAEHGIGQSNVGRLLQFKPPLEIEFMRSIKDLFDPRGIMNPGKLF